MAQVLSKASLITIDDAFAQIVQPARPVAGEERAPLGACLGRILSRDVVSAVALPRFDHAAMDGFGLSAADLGRHPPFPLHIGGRVFAGGAVDTSAEAGVAVRLLTGAPIPPGVEAVIAEESCAVTGSVVRPLKRVSAGTNIRRRGEDVPQGSIVIEAGTRLDARHLAMLAACDIRDVPVRRRVRVGLLSVGDELRRAGEPLAAGQIPDTNGPMLAATLASPSVDLVDFGLQRDDRAGLAALIGDAAGKVDLLVSSAGVSGSDADHVSAAVGDAGGMARPFKLALKPGKPLLTGIVGTTPIVGLPGNPVAALVNFMLFVRPLVAVRAGMRAMRPQGHAAAVAEAIGHREGRAEFIPGRIVGWSGDGCTRVMALRPAGAARLRPLVLADGLIEISACRDDVAAGEMVAFHQFEAAFAT